MIKESLNFNSYPVALISIGFLFLIISQFYFSKFTNFYSISLEAFTLGISFLFISIGILKLKNQYDLQIEKLNVEISALRNKR